MRVIFGQVIRHTGQARVDVTAAQVLGCDNFACRGPYKGWTRQKDRALFFHNDRHIRHGRHICPARRTRPHNHSDLRNAFGAHLRLIVENPAKVIAVGENFVLIGQVRAATVDQIDAGQIVLFGDLLCTQVLFDGHRIIGAALHGGVVAHNHHLVALHPANACNDTRTRGGAIVHAMGCRRANFQKGGSGIEQVRDTLTGQHLATRDMAFTGPVAAAKSSRLGRGIDLAQSRTMRCQICFERLRRGQDL